MLEDKVFSLPGRGLGRPPRRDVLHFLLSAEPWGSERQGRGGGCDIKGPPKVSDGSPAQRPPSPASLSHTHTHNILSYKCHEDKFGVGQILALLLLFSLPWGGTAVVNCPISGDSVNWWKG